MGIEQTCIFVITPSACTNCDVEDKLMCLVNHRNLVVAKDGKVILQRVLWAEINAKTRIK